MQDRICAKHYEELLDYFPENCKFLKVYDRIAPFFDSLELKDKDIVLAVSGGADSMLVATYVLFHYKYNELDISRIHIAHCNHKIRKESEGEAEFMKQFFKGLDLHVFERDTSLPEDESSLRNRRYSQFSLLQKSTKSSYVFVGHHLNDRVESTFLNLLRGCGINGFTNMHKLEEHHLLPEGCKVCRPLLEINKSDILDICETIGIPYFEDKTNLDNSVSKRNYVRNQIINPLSKNSRLLESFSNIYTEIENYEKKTKIDLINMPSFPAWNAEYSYLWNLNILKCDENDLFELFKFLRIQASSALINERKEWLNSGENGYKYVAGTYFFIHEEQLYIIKADKDFWEKKIDNKSLTVESADFIEYYGFKLDIPRDELIGSEVRLPEEGDTFAGKKWSRWTLNQKIPMWWRNWIPVSTKNGKVIHMWKNIRKN